MGNQIREIEMIVPWFNTIQYKSLPVYLTHRRVTS